MVDATIPAPILTAPADSFEQLFRVRYRELVRLATMLLGNTDGAEDVVQSAFLELHRRWGSLDDVGRASGYLARSVVNGCRSQHRRNIVRRRQPEAPVWWPSAEAEGVDRLIAETIVGALGTLPARQREAVVCHYSLQLTVAETAEALQISVPSVKTHLQRARRTLAPLLKGLQ